MARLYLGDCRTILPIIVPETVSLVVTDPPYGIGVRANYKDRKRGALAVCNNFADIVGDDSPFDPTALLRFKRLVIFGGNHFADKLPSSSSWLVWDKVAGMRSKREVGFNDNADCELIWTNCGGPVRVIPHLWMGILKDSEKQERRVHPTQKPITLMESIIAHYTKPGDLILDPYMGSGSTIVAALRCGRRAIGMEIAEGYYDIACERAREAAMQPELFSRDEVSA